MIRSRFGSFEIQLNLTTKRTCVDFGNRRSDKIVWILVENNLFQRIFRIKFILNAKIVQFVQIEFRRHHKYLMLLNFKSKRSKLLKSFVDFSSGDRSSRQYYDYFWWIVLFMLSAHTSIR